MLAARVEPKNGPKRATARQLPRSPLQRPYPSRPAALDQNTISSTTSKRQSGAHSRMITIPGTSDHHHLEFVITIVWND
jgi:hypothetical protein